MKHPNVQHKPMVRQIVPLHMLAAFKPDDELLNAEKTPSGNPLPSGRQQGVNFGVSLCSLQFGHPSFREPENDEWIIGLYRENDGTFCPILLWADPTVDLFWDPSLRNYVRPPGSYLRLTNQPQIDGRTGYPIVDGAVCPY
jgi:hypothetical protein